MADRLNLPGGHAVGIAHGGDGPAGLIAAVLEQGQETTMLVGGDQTAHQSLGQHVLAARHVGLGTDRRVEAFLQPFDRRFELGRRHPGTIRGGFDQLQRPLAPVAQFHQRRFDRLGVGQAEANG